MDELIETSSSSSSSSKDSSSSSSSVDSSSSSSSSSIDSSSSSSSSSSSIDSSSSSSSSSEGKIGLFFASVQQQNHNLLPFSLFIEKGIAGSNNLEFEFETASNFLDFSKLVNVNSEKTLEDNSTTYIPHDALMDHESSFYVELIAKDKSGIKRHNLRSQAGVYQYRDTKDSFNIPKFSWSNDLFFKPVKEENDKNKAEVDINNQIWVGDESFTLSALQYDDSSISTLSQISLDSEPYSVLWKHGSVNMYVTQLELLEEYVINDGAINGSTPSIKKLNTDKDVIAFSDADSIWTLQAYSGKVLNRDASNWSVISEYSGFDAPRKMRWSAFHDAFFIAGTNVLWQLKNGVKSSVYEIDKYEIIDFDVSESGYMSILFKSEGNDLIRILKPDLFSIAFDELIAISDTVRHTTYCDNGVFYVLVESDNDQRYIFSNYLFDVIDGTRYVSHEEVTLSKKPQETTQEVPSKKVEVFFPAKDDKFKQGESIDILWGSLASASDQIKIDLFKDGDPHSVITFSTNNSGVYKWTVPDSLDNGSGYQIKLTWIAATELDENTDTSEPFIVFNAIEVEASLPITTVYESIGIGFNRYNGHVVNVLSNGYVGYVDLSDMVFHGLFNGDFKSGGNKVTCMVVKQNSFENSSNIIAMRVFVGSQQHYSDKWDSGVIETNKTEIYYGGGNNLMPGEKYYVNIQVQDAIRGWSGVQTKEFIMPK